MPGIYFGKTMKPIKSFTLDQIKSAMIAKGYKWFEEGDFNLNLIGVRNSDTGDTVTNAFDDTFFIAYRDAGKWKIHNYACTTDPGAHWQQAPMNAGGTASLVPNQYRSTWRIDLHQGIYKALKQFKPVDTYRDKNRDLKYTRHIEDITNGIYGINIHRASATGVSNRVDKWSAGCQVIADSADFANLMYLAHVAEKKYGNSFTYTLLESKNIK
jgi:hypothetical protein